MNEYNAIEFVNERLAEHEARVHLLTMQHGATAAAAVEAAEPCGVWCQVKRRGPAFRSAFHPR